ncbi:MAG: hypothetical protein AABN95_25140 [Acidobacteriota bacterium]
MLQAVPKGWFSSKYIVSENDTPIGMIDMSGWRESAELTIKGAIYQVYRQGLMTGSFVLDAGGSILARADKPSAFYRSFVVEVGGKKYSLEATSTFSCKFVLSEEGKQIGSVHREGFLARKAIADFPDEIQLPFRMFMFWLVMILWRRSDSAAS